MAAISIYGKPLQNLLLWYQNANYPWAHSFVAFWMLSCQQESEYDLEIPQSHTARAIEHQHLQDIRKASKVKQPAPSVKMLTYVDLGLL